MIQLVCFRHLSTADSCVVVVMKWRHLHYTTTSRLIVGNKVFAQSRSTPTVVFLPALPAALLLSLAYLLLSVFLQQNQRTKLVERNIYENRWKRYCYLFVPSLKPSLTPKCVFTIFGSTFPLLNLIGHMPSVWVDAESMCNRRRPKHSDEY